MERYKFNQAQQAATESVVDFVARLKHLSLNCNFTDANVTIRDRLVCGLRDHATKKKLLSETDLKYENAYKIALAMEAAEKDATVTEKTSTEVAANTNSVNWMQKSRQKRQQQGRRGRSNNRGGGGRGKTYNNSNASKSSSSSKQSTNRQAPSCHCCGGANHMAQDCFHRYQTCRACKKKGHLKAMCRAKKTEVQHVQSVTESHREEETAHDFYFAEEDNNISRVGNITSVYDGIRAEPMYVNVFVNDIAINMEVDTRTYATIISEEVQNKFSEYSN